MLSLVMTLLLLSCTHRVTVWMRGKTGQCRISCHGYESKTAINNHPKRASKQENTGPPDINYTGKGFQYGE